MPDLVEPRGGSAVAGLLTHLHRDHADAGALRRALRPGASVFHPVREIVANPLSSACQQAKRELDASGLDQVTVAEWDTVRVGEFEATAVPASDGLGDEQVSWIVRAGGCTIVHCGDTMAHGSWWRIREAAGTVDVAFVPINAPVVQFPHLQPPSSQPVAMNAFEALEASRVLGTALAVPIHHSGYDAGPIYRPENDALERFRLAARGIPVANPKLGSWTDVTRIR